MAAGEGVIALLQLHKVHHRRWPEPEVPIQLLWRINFGYRRRLGGAADARFHGLDLAKPAVANQLAGQAEARVRTLLTAHLKDGLLVSSSLEENFAFVDGQCERLFAIDVLT